MIVKATGADIASLGILMSELWPHHSPEEMAAEAAQLLRKRDAALFLKWDEEKAIGCRW